MQIDACSVVHVPYLLSWTKHHKGNRVCGKANQADMISDEAEVYTFGANKFGQLGHGSDTPNNMPHKVMGLADKSVQHIACGDTFTAAATKGHSA